MTSPRPSRLRTLPRSAAGVLAVVGCALGATGCGLLTRDSAQGERITTTPGPTDLVASAASDGEGWETGFSPPSGYGKSLATASGPVMVLCIKAADSSRITDETILAALDPQDGSLRWSLTVSPTIESRECTTSRESAPQHKSASASDTVGSPGPVVVSPDGRYISLQLSSNESSTIAGTRAGVLVLDASTGETVRTLQTTGLVLGQVLTDSDLVVQTAQDYVPAGSGTLTVAPLDEPEAEPSTLRTDQWLVGSASDAVLLSPDCLPRGSAATFTSTTITEMSAGGETLATIPAVYRVLEAGRVERYTDPAAANDAAAAASSPNPAWAATNREVLDIETGTTTDITGFAAAPLALPDGPGIRLDRVLEAEPAADGSPGTAAWIGTADDGGTVRTEDVSAVEVDKRDSAHEDQYHFSLTLRPISVEAP